MIDILDMNEVQRVIEEINAYKNVNRKRNEYINYEIGDDLLRKYVKQKIKEMYPKTHELFTISEYSLIKKVRDKKAKAYKESPIRKLEVESETDEYLDILDVGRFDDAVKDLDKIYNQHKYAGFFFEKDSEKDRINFYPLRPYEFDIVKDDYGRVVCLILSYPGAQVTHGHEDKIIAGDRADEDMNETVYSFWTNDNHMVVACSTDKKGKVRKIDIQELPDNPGHINPYGRIPFAYLPFDFNEDYPSSSSLSDKTIELNSLISTYLSSANLQLGQLVISHPEDQPINTVSQGMMTAIKLPQSSKPEDKPSTAQYISPNPNLSGHREAIITYLSMILDEEGINAKQSIEGHESFPSGFDRLLSEADVQDIIEDNQEAYVRFEQECFEVINAMLFSYFRSTKTKTTFRKPKLLISDSEKLKNLGEREKLGLMEEHEKFMFDDPNLTVEEAKEKALRINEEKKKREESFSKIKSNEISSVKKGTNNEDEEIA